jgi:oxalate decarboxylase/phosphoglucose isomerase-like protein (cupin superfamily)
MKQLSVRSRAALLEWWYPNKGEASMNDFRPAGRLLLALALAFCFAGCANTPQNKWTIWYIPNEPHPGVVTNRSCSTLVFASAPNQSKYVVAVFKGWAGANRPTGVSAQVHTGENFTGDLPIGNVTVHDDSNGYNIALDSVYIVESYMPAKVRADADCPTARR